MPPNVPQRSICEHPPLAASDTLRTLTPRAVDIVAALPSSSTISGFLKKIIHDWPDDRAEQILRCCRKAMSSTPRLLLIELVVPPADAATFTKFLDLWMLVWPGGRERTEDEYRKILNAADLSLTKIIPTQSPISLIEAVPT
jgi:hypothetical protein